MEVILNENVPSLGFVGDVVRVKAGYARNFLLRRGLAVLADPKNKEELEHRRRVLEVKRSSLLKEAKDAAAKLADVSIAVIKTAGPEGKLYGSVTTTEITELLLAQNIVVDRKLVSLKEPIKAIGSYLVTVKLHPEVVATIKLEVTKAAE